MKVAALISGGKDSIYALDRAIQEGHTTQKQASAGRSAKLNEPVCVVAIKSENPESYMFHVPAIELTKLQAKAMSLPIIFHTTKGEKEKELDDLKLALREAKELGAEAVVSGALASNYQKSRIEKICKELDLQSITPLWHIDTDKYMNDLLASGYKIIITSVAADGLDESWVGKQITMQRLNKLRELAKKYRFNIAGEGGEYETLVIDCPLFKHKIGLKKQGTLQTLSQI